MEDEITVEDVNRDLEAKYAGGNYFIYMPFPKHLRKS